MKNVTIAKQLIVILSVGIACSAHAQLLGRGGSIGGNLGGMIGGGGGFGGQLGGITSIAGRGDMPERVRTQGSNPASSEPAKQRAVNAGGNGTIQGTLGAGTINSSELAGSAGQGARGTAQPLQEGTRLLAGGTYDYAQSSAATATSSARAAAQGGADGMRGVGREAASVQPSGNAGASLNGAAQGAAGSAAESQAKTSTPGKGAEAM